MSMRYAPSPRAMNGGCPPTAPKARAGLLTSAGLASKRRYAIVAMFAVAAVLTPPDVISQICLAIPLIILYEVSIYSCRMVERGRAKREAEEEAALAADAKPAPGE